MRKVVFFQFLSLDGVAERPGRFVTDWDDVMDASGAALIATQDAVILGRRSYDEWAEFWPGSEIEPFATFINGVAKYVATSSPLEREWANTTVIDGDLVEYVRDLKDRAAGDIGVHASISVARGLLDELPLIRLESIRSVTSPSGHLLVDYRPIEWAGCHAVQRPRQGGLGMVYFLHQRSLDVGSLLTVSDTLHPAG